MTPEQKANRRLLIWFLITLLISILPWIVFAQGIKKGKFNFNKQQEDEIGYSEAVKVGNTLYVSGVVGSGNMPDAVKEVYDRIQRILTAHGATFQNVVKENVFATDIESFIQHKDLRKEYYKGDYPAATWVEVKRLYSPDLHLEVEIIAVLGN